MVAQKFVHGPLVPAVMYDVPNLMNRLALTQSFEHLSGVFSWNGVLKLGARDTLRGPFDGQKSGVSFDPYANRCSRKCRDIAL